jgi:hypothetical protein
MGEYLQLPVFSAINMEKCRWLSWAVATAAAERVKWDLGCFAGEEIEKRERERKREKEAKRRRRRETKYANINKGKEKKKLDADADAGGRARNS